MLLKSKSMKTVRYTVAAAAVLAVAVGGYFWMSTRRHTEVVPGEATVRRLSAEQYRNIVSDVFGPTIQLGGRFEPEIRVEGLLEIGAAHNGITPAGMEQYDVIARTIAGQVVDAEHRRQFIHCQPASASKPDASCAARFLGDVGKLLYRRPLTSEQLDIQVEAARVATEKLGDFYGGLSLSLAAMLTSPEFLFRQVVLEPDPDAAGGYRLDAYSKASRLSFFLWNSSPDLLLLEAAASGELNTRKGLLKQVDRMMASPRFENGLRAFFADNLQFDAFEQLAKDAMLFPKFDADVAKDAKEETLRVLVDLLLKKNGDYRDIFTTKSTYLTPRLGSIYQVPLANHAPNGAAERWQPFSFPADDPRGGLLTQVAFTALHSPPGRGSPTLRGKALREVFFCQKVPAPPADVNFAIVQDTKHPLYKTARQRLQVHAVNPSCSGCHKIMDPIGLALENFDGAGAFRTAENGEAIDTAGEIDGTSFSDGASLSAAVSKNPAAVKCLAQRLSSYALGRKPSKGEKAWVAAMEQEFSEGSYSVPNLIREISISEAFYLAAAPADVDRSGARAADSRTALVSDGG